MKKMCNKIGMMVAAAIVFGAVLLLSVNRGADGQWNFTMPRALAEAPGTECDQCVLKDTKGKIVFSCKSVANESCSAKQFPATVSCNNAKSCN